MLSGLFVGLLSISVFADKTSNEPSGNLYISWGAGYTHYEAGELNEAMVLLAKKTSDSSGGFNNYSRGEFDGHPYQIFELGYELDSWRLSVELDYWVEEFTQEDVSFYTKRNEDPQFTSTDQLNCEILRDPNFIPLSGSITGCLEARQSFAFIPITLNLGYQFKPLSQLYISPSYGIGIMGGLTETTVSTDYIFGRTQGDTLSFEIWPGVNLLQKLALDIEYRPWPSFGMSLRGGWRISQLAKFEISNKTGNSEIFDVVMGDPIENGQRLYIQSFPNTSKDENELVSLTKDQFILSDKYYNQIQGDFSGWFITMKLYYYLEL